MSRRVLFAITFFLLGLLAGWVSRRVLIPTSAWFTYLAVAFLALIAGIFGTLAFIRSKSRDAVPRQELPAIDSERSSPEQIKSPFASVVADKPVPLPLTSQKLLRPAPASDSHFPRLGSTQVYWLSSHLALTRSGSRLNLRLNHLGKYEFIRFSISLPQESRSTPAQSKPAAALALRQSVLPLQILTRPSVISWVLFGFALLVFALTRFVALDQFPIYFFSDEAINPVLALELIQRGMRDSNGMWFPPYFQNHSIWNLSLSVYIHAVTVWLFGMSIWITRATNALIALSSAAAVGLTFKYIFNIRRWWLGTLVLAAIPAWFLHSRTGFETGLMVSFYSWFLLTYLLYRYRDPRFIYAALIFAAATFYSYANGQAIIAVTAILLLLSDFRYHLKQRRIFWGSLLLLGVLAIPYLRFHLAHPDAIELQLRVVDSYWLNPIPLGDKVNQFVQKYFSSLSPLYWFFPNQQDLVRHRVKEYGHIVWWLLPFFLIGALVCMARWKSSAYRVVLIALAAAPVGSALANILVTRALVFVIPAAMLMVIGFDFLISKLRSIRWQWAAASAATAVLAIFSLAMLNDAVVNGPLWYDNYGLGGMQWGAKQLFEILQSERQAHPQMPIVVTSTWANGADVFLKFFMPHDRNITMSTIDTWIQDQVPLASEQLFVTTASELEQVRASGKFNDPIVERELDYPTGTPGFYFVRFTYVPDINQIFEQERLERAKPVTDEVEIHGETVEVIHSRMDYGQSKDMFDGDSYTLARGLEANPLFIELHYPSPRPMHELYATFGKMHFSITISLWAPGAQQPIIYTQTVKSEADIPEVTMHFDNPRAQVDRVRVEIKNLDAQGPTKIHVRELQLR